MKVVILAGGFGTRLAEETELKPKPMVEVGRRPILWHIMKHYAFYGYNEFVIALGYRGEVIKRYFYEQTTLRGNLTFEMQTGGITVRNENYENWVVHLVDTGLSSNTGGRIGRLQEYLENKPFMLTYGDGVSNIDIDALVTLHKKNNLMVTLTAVRPPARFGEIVFDGDIISQFNEKPQIGEGWINGGFMVMEPEILEYIPSDSTNLESQVLNRLAAEKQLVAYRHNDFWQCMDTIRDKKYLESLWENERAPWKIW